MKYLRIIEKIPFHKFLNVSFLVEEGTNNKTWIESYSPAQEELENHCFIAVDVSYEHLFTSCQSDCM